MAANINDNGFSAVVADGPVSGNRYLLGYAFFQEHQVSALWAAVAGSGSPSIDWTIRYGDFDAVGTEVETGGWTTTDEGGAEISLVASIPAGNAVWVEIDSVGAGASQLVVAAHVTRILT